MHRITDVCEQTRAGTCSICGPVKVKHKGFKKDGTKKWQCWTLETQQEINYRHSPKGRQTRKRATWKYQNRCELSAAVCDRYNVATHCDCCGKPRPKDNKHFHIDHDHTTGKIRGFLCRECNTGLGFFQDSIPTLQKAIKYIERSVELNQRT